jgi:hypothetical protein
MQSLNNEKCLEKPPEKWKTEIVPDRPLTRFGSCAGSFVLEYFDTVSIQSFFQA